MVLSMLHCQRDYKAKDEKRVAKFMPQYDGPYLITDMAPKILTVTVDLLNNPNTFPTFHTSQVLPFMENDDSLFLDHEEE